MKPETPVTPASRSPATDPAVRRRNRLKLFGVLAVCAAPVIASYLTYYVVKPQGRTNYGELIDPQRPVSALSASLADGRADTLAAFRGKWVLAVVAPQGCEAACADRLVTIRQVRLTTGRDRDRVERLLLLTDAVAPSPALLAQHEGLQVRRADPAQLLSALPSQGRRDGESIYVIDPLGNLMMRFPADGDPTRIKKDIAKLLRASRIG